MSVTAQNTQYTEFQKQWELVRDCVAGSDAVKKRGGGSDSGTLVSSSGTRYLPAPNASDTSTENIARYDAYKKRASYINFTGHTKDGMLGLVFSKEPEVKLPTAIDYMEDNANGGGMSLEQFARDITGDVLETGREGILVDYPSAPSGQTEEQVKASGNRANLVPYTAESIINWRTEIIGSVKMVTMIVLAEEHEEVDDDGFDSETVMKYRVLKLDNGIYSQSLYDEGGVQEAIDFTVNEEEETVGVFEILPTMANGKHWEIIPFVFIGAQNNDETVDKPPLYDIANTNIAHYRNSADFEESSFMVGQPTPVFTGLTQTWVKDVMNDTATLGSRAAIPLPVGANAMLLQADPNQMPMKGMEEKEKQIVMIGARLIQDSGGVETAEAARIRYAGQNSKLGALVGNVSDGIEQACVYALMFMSPTYAESMNDEVEVDINDQFYEKTIDPQLIMAMIASMDRGILAKTDVRDKLRQTGITARTDEDIEAEAEETSPIGGGSNGTD